MYCKKCGTEISEEFSYCPKCGERQTCNYCKSCGKEVAADADYCPYCGTRIRESRLSDLVKNIFSVLKKGFTYILPQSDTGIETEIKKDMAESERSKDVTSSESESNVSDLSEDDLKGYEGSLSIEEMKINKENIPTDHTQSSHEDQTPIPISPVKAIEYEYIDAPLWDRFLSTIIDKGVIIISFLFLAHQ